MAGHRCGVRSRTVLLNPRIPPGTGRGRARAIASPVIERLTGAGISVTGLVKRGWMVLVAVAVVAVAGFSVYRLHGIFGSHDTTSTAGGVANDIAVQPQTGNPRGLWRSRNRGNDQLSGRGCHTSASPGHDPAVVIHDHDDPARGLRQCCRARRQQFHRLPHHRQRCSQDERIVNEVRAYTFCLDKSS